MNPFQSHPKDFRQLLIFGAGGFGREVAWLARQRWGSEIDLCFMVDRPEYLADDVHRIPVRLLDDCAAKPDSRCIIALGSPAQRRAAAMACKSRGLSPTVVVHPRVEASDTVSIGSGSVICAGTILTVDIEIGPHVHVNLACTIGHDVKIGGFSTLAPGVHVSGNVNIGEGVSIGTGATIINGDAGNPLLIGDGAVIAAGACVTKSVEPSSLVAGVPAVLKRRPTL